MKFYEFKCANCGKAIKNGNELNHIKIGKEVYFLCSKCKEISEEFKERHKLT